MRFLKGLLAFFLIIIIVGGVAYVGWNIYVDSQFNNSMDMTSDNTQDNTNNEETDMSNMNNSTDNAEQNVAIPNPQDAENREKMSKAIDLIDEAVELITIDPYSNATVPDSSDPMQMDNSQGQASQVTGTINIYPSDNSSVNLTPSSDTATNDNGMNNTETQSTMGKMDTVSNQSNNFVYDQAKLQQLHSGIYTVAQGILAINELSDNLLNQSMRIEQAPFTYQTHVLRYSAALQNKADLENALTMLDKASILINVNPYASENGYAYKNDNMKQLHEGIYKYAQGMALLESLGEDFTNQMTTASMSAQNLIYSANQMDMSGSIGTSLFSNINMSTIFNIIIIILVIGLIIGILGAISNLFKNKVRTND